jgi:uncharacterized protein YicC (UPF0701 family)
MFILKETITAFWPVRVKEPNPKSPGTFTEYKFEVEFTLLNRDQAQAQNDLRSEMLKDEMRTAKEILDDVDQFDTNSFVEAISDWRGVYDEAKNEIPYSRDMLITAMNRPLIRKAIAEAYNEMASGEGRRKN